MVKRIEKSQLRQGMFIEAVEGFLLDSPILNRRFLVTNHADVETIKSSNVTGVFINPAKGADVVAVNKPIAARKQTAMPKSQRRSGERTPKKIAFDTIIETTAALKTIFHDAGKGEPLTAEMVAPVVRRIIDSIDVDPTILVSMTRLKSRDQTSFLHSIAVCALMVRFGRDLGCDEQTVLVLGMSGLLHDIGKVSIPLRVLNKAGALSDAEMTLIKRHPTVGHEILSRKPGMPVVVLDVCLHHHERLDGKGYPEGKKEHEISRAARMSAICDVYDALTSARPYREPWTSDRAAAWMRDTTGVFDRSLLSKFFQSVVGF
ncbi:HD-GYP domain-containing protein [Ensifer sp. YR511]|uniref:HD-GYP domain-containing protein n=1 Tax=Ensifer sp. YR511 TaxID=1855294 RepID=UPI00087F2146|nr:HD-GYP domain-containing protein [Ensifer sp. YR511]SDN34520.1 HDIG domain-containing protein [Ensifer sp. YR511]